MDWSDLDKVAHVKDLLELPLVVRSIWLLVATLSTLTSGLFKKGALANIDGP